MDFPFKLLSSAVALLIVGASAALAQTSVQVGFTDLEQPYNGNLRLPTVITNPNTPVTLTTTPRISETVFKTTPAVLDLSYPSVALAGTANKALGDVINLGGTQRMLESVDVVLVNWATAAEWPTLAAANPAGYVHPITVLVYRQDGSSLTLAQETQNVLVPWRPATLDDGSPYPYSGKAFKVRVNFPMGFTLTNSTRVLVAFNTQNSGANPIGTAGPYNALRVALTGNVPTVGTDANPGTMLLLDTALKATSTFGAIAPMFEIRGFPASPPSGESKESGFYFASATVNKPGFTGSGTAEFRIVPLNTDITLSNLAQIADGTPRPIAVVTTPPGRAHQILYAGSSTPPTAPGSYPVKVVSEIPNYYGEKTGTLIISNTFAYWAATRVTAGTLPANQAGALDDPDGDGLSNLLEYAFALDPSSPANLGHGTGQLAFSNLPTTFTLTYRKQFSPADLTYRLETSTDLTGPWANAIGTETSAGSDGLVQILKITVDKPAADTKRFYRMRVTQN